MHRLLLLLWLLSLAACADPLDLPDALARAGAYRDAEALYEKCGDSPRALSRRLTLAQLRGDAKVFAALCKRLPTPPDAEVARREALDEGLLAYRSGHRLEAERAFARVPEGYERSSYDYQASLLNSPIPSAASYRKAYRQAAQAVPAGEQWPLDQSRMNVWRTEWIRKAIEISWTLYWQQDAAGSYEWKRLAREIGVASICALAPEYEASRDPELAYGLIYCLLELANGYPGEPDCGAWLATCQAYLVGGDEAGKAYPQYRYEEQQHAWGRYLRAQAGYDFYAQRYDAALQGLQSAIPKLRPLEQIDAALALASYSLFYQAPASWTAACRQNLELALGRSRLLDYPLGEFLALAYQGKAQALGHQLPDAEKSLRQALALLNSWVSQGTPETRRLQLAKSRWFFDLLVDVLIQQGKPAEAFEVSQQLEQANALVSVDLDQISPRKPETKLALRAVQTTREALASMESQPNTPERKSQLAQNKQEFYQALNRVRASDAGYERLLAVRPTAFAKLQSHLPGGMLLVEYYAAEDRLYVFSATRKELKIHTVAYPRATLDADVRKVHKALLTAARDGVELEATAQDTLVRLHENLISPLDSCSTLAIVPGGTLYYLPFAALRSKSGEYLIQRQPLVVLTNLEILELTRDAKPVLPTSLLALANPDGTLPAAQQEVDSISPLFAHHQTFSGKEATKDKIRLIQGASVLHLATHGALNSRDVNQSFLVMGGEGADARLTAGEIYALDFHDLSLVTLSACQTAVGESEPGAEIATLAQAFSLAGSNSILASLWRVDDTATAELMVNFYKQLLAGKSKAEALQAAQLAVLREPRFANPYFWAAFELIGDWR